MVGIGFREGEDSKTYLKMLKQMSRLNVDK